MPPEIVVPEPPMSLRTVLPVLPVLLGLALIGQAALAQDSPATPVPPERPAGVETAQPTVPPDVKPPPTIGGVQPTAMGQGGEPILIGTPQKQALQRVNEYLNRLRVMSGSFTQVNPDGTRSTGKFWISKPGKMRFQYAPPSPVELVADGRSLAVRDRKLNTQDLYYISQTPLRFLLSDKIDLTADARVIGVVVQPDWIVVTLEEKSTFAGTARIQLRFSADDASLKQWTVTDAQGYETTVALYDVDTSTQPSDKLFRIDEHRTL
jgi:outer membrane lipoprotein-sorting protein